MTVAGEVCVVWRNDKYEKCSKSSELFENYNFLRTPRDNSSQNSPVRNIVKINQNDELSSKPKGF